MVNELYEMSFPPAHSGFLSLRLGKGSKQKSQRPNKTTWERGRALRPFGKGPAGGTEAGSQPGGAAEPPGPGPELRAGHGRGAAELRAHRVRFGFAVSSETHRSNATPLASASCSEPGRGAKSRGDGPHPPACRLSKTPFPQDRFAGVKSAPPRRPPSKARASRVFPHCLPSSNVSAWTFPVRATRVRVSGPGTSQLCHLLLLGTSCRPQELICLCFQCSVTWSTGRGHGAETLVQNSGEPGE